MTRSYHRTLRTSTKPNFLLLAGVYLASKARKHGDLTILPNSRFCLQADGQPQELKDSLLQGRGFGEPVEFVLGLGSPSDSVLAQRRQVLQKTLKTLYRKTVRRTTVVFLLLGRFRTWCLGNDRLTRGFGRFPLVIVEEHFGQFRSDGTITLTGLLPWRQPK